jgi:5-methylcytosine-specific restriction endonuclease McrA
MLTSDDEKQIEEASQRHRRLLREAQKRYRDRHPERIKEIRQRCEVKETSKEKRRIRQRKGRLQNRLRAIAELGGKCFHCQEAFHHAAMDFHHVDPASKEIKGRGIPASNSWEKIEQELAKTILLCSNCHRVHHYKEHSPDE